MTLTPEDNRKRNAYYDLLEAKSSIGKVFGAALTSGIVGKREQNKILKCSLAVEALIEDYYAWGDCDD
jgi:hypothetical protein